MASKANGKTGASGRNSGGGGINTRQHVKPTVRGGPAVTKKISPAAAANLGNAKGNHASDSGGRQMNRPVEPLQVGTRPQVKSGNAVALEVGRGGPGVGRILHGPSGTQGKH